MSLEQHIRDMLERAGDEDAQSRTAGDLVEIGNHFANALVLARFVNGLFPMLKQRGLVTDNDSLARLQDAASQLCKAFGLPPDSSFPNAVQPDTNQQ